MTRRLRSAAYWALVLVLFLAAAEVASRLDDWVLTGTPFTANPDRLRDLVVKDEFGTHGRPHGRYRKWQLNEFGFRAPAMTLEPPAGRQRIMVLGASETFGLFEPDGKEYVAQFADSLKKRGCTNCEVINAAMAGISVGSMRPYWEEWVARFRPAKVLIYPSPMLYLDDKSEPPPDEALTDVGEPRFESRFYARVRDTFRRFEPVRRARVEYLLAESLAGKGDDWLFPSVPPDRLALFTADLEALVGSIRKSGAEPVLLTHAVKAANPPRPEDAQDLRDMRIFFPQAAGDTLVAFEDAAAQAVRDLGRKHQLTVIDVAAAMNGHREWFADLVHFTEPGAAVIADALCPEGNP
jgi:hypothetical protein